MLSCTIDVIVLFIIYIQYFKPMEALIKYVQACLGIEMVIKPLPTDRLKILPLYMAHAYSFSTTELFRKPILLVQLKEEVPAERLRKHLEILNNTFNIQTIAIIERLESYNRLRLTEKKVPFIIPGKQMFIPELLIDLKERGTGQKEPPLAMPSAVQVILLYHLQVKSLEGINLKGIADLLQFNAMAVTRGSYFLHNTGLCSLLGTKEKTLHFNKVGLELWNAAETYMVNPIKRSTYYTGQLLDNSLLKTNITALSHYSMLNPEAIEYYATKAGNLKYIEGVNLKNFGPLEGNICIEEWKYNPHILTMTEYVDPLSLYLCFRNHPDERVEEAANNLIEKFRW